MKYYLGIDPGLSGALAFFNPMTNELETIDMPTHSITVNNKKKNLIDMHQLANLINCKATEIKMAIVEEVGAMPGQGVTSMFSFGFTAGAIQMAVIANAVPLLTIRPSVWKKAMGLPVGKTHDKKENKDIARRFASRLMPAHASKWPLVKHDGRAEAALLALYLARAELAGEINSSPMEDLI